MYENVTRKTRLVGIQSSSYRGKLDFALMTEICRGKETRDTRYAACPRARALLYLCTHRAAAVGWSGGNGLRSLNAV